MDVVWILQCLVATVHVLFSCGQSSSLGGPTAACIAAGCPNNIDAMDLGPDGLYYIFSCNSVYTVDKVTQARTQPVTISDLFRSIVTPVIAAFSTGPTNGRMYIIDSDPATNLKSFSMTRADVLPRFPTSISSMAAVFPAASAIFPTPMTSAFASFVPPQVYFIGGSAGNRSVGIYSYSAATGSFTSNGKTTIQQPAYASAWDEDLKASTMYYDPLTGKTEFFLISLYQTIQVDIPCMTVTILAGPSCSGSSSSLLTTSIPNTSGNTAPFTPTPSPPTTTTHGSTTTKPLLTTTTPQKSTTPTTAYILKYGTSPASNNYYYYSPTPPSGVSPGSGGGYGGGAGGGSGSTGTASGGVTTSGGAPSGGCPCISTGGIASPGPSYSVVTCPAWQPTFFNPCCPPPNVHASQPPYAGTTAWQANPSPPVIPAVTTALHLQTTTTTARPKTTTA